MFTTLRAWIRRKLRPHLLGDNFASSEINRRPMGSCDACGKSFSYRLIHCGFSDAAYAYCERCGLTALLSGWDQGIPAGALPRVHGVIDRVSEAYLRTCECGGTHRTDAPPRCPACKAAISAETATAWIEADAPGTKLGWRWQRSWTGLYAIVIDDRMVSDNWIAKSTE